MTLDFGTHASASGGVDKAFQRAVDVGSTSMQLFTKNERQWKTKPLDPDVIDRFHEERERTGIRQVVSHASYLINLASPKDDLIEKSMGGMTEELERANVLGVQGVVLHPGAHTGSGEEAGILKIAESMNRLHDQLPDITSLTLLETTAGQGTVLGRTFEQIAEIIDKLEAKDRVGVCLDTCHIFTAGYDIRTAEGYTDVIDTFDRVIGINLLRAIHVNDSKMPFASNKDRHEHIGEGEIGPEAFRMLVNDKRLADLPGILETEKDPDGENDRKNLKVLRDLVEK